MTGLEKLVKHIEDQAKSSAGAIIKGADIKADEIIGRAKAESKTKSVQILEKSKTDIKSALDRAKSAALLQEKKLLLNAKQKMIENTIEKARKSLIYLPDNEYFGIILKMIKKYSVNLDGEIIFSAKDKARLPDGFIKQINAYTDRNRASLKISEQTRKIDGGFILQYGDIEENCSFEALFFAKKDIFTDKVSKILFG